MKETTLNLSLSLATLLCAALSVAASPTLAQQTGDAKTAGEAADATEPIKITYKEVQAVQAELQRRGYFNSDVSGVLDAETREAIRTYQKESKLAETGRIDRATITSLGLTYPATGNEVESMRRAGLIPRTGNAVKDGASATGHAVTSTAKGVKDGAVLGADKTVEKTKDLASDAADKTGEVARTVGLATADTAKKAGRKVSDKTVRAGQRVSEVFVGRSDAEIQRDVRDVLARDERTARVRSEVRDGAVRLTANADIDLSTAVSGIRKLSGVKSVVVVAQ